MSSRKIPNPLRALDFPYRAPPVPLGVEPPPVEPTTGAHFDTEWSRRPAARVARQGVVTGLMGPVVKVLARPEVRGLDRLADIEGPVVFVANHHSHLDTPLLITSIPTPWRHDLVVGAAADYFFRTRVSGAAAALALGAIPIERTKVERGSANLAASLIADGWSLLLYPEGGRSPDGWGQPFRGGAAYLAVRCAVPVVPVHLNGTGAILGKGRSIPRPSRTTVTFGSPLAAADGETSRKFSARIEAAVAELADEVTTDWWQARRRAHAGTTPGLGGPAASSWRRQWALGDPTARTRRRKRRWPDLG